MLGSVVSLASSVPVMSSVWLVKATLRGLYGPIPFIRILHDPSMETSSNPQFVVASENM